MNELRQYQKLVLFDQVSLPHTKTFAPDMAKVLDEVADKLGQLSPAAKPLLGFDEEMYHRSHFAVSKHDLDKLTETPRHYYAGLTRPEQKKRAFEFGKLAHSIILEPELVDERYVSDIHMEEEVRKMNKNTKVYKNARAKLEATGKKMISHEEYLELRQVADSILMQPRIGGLLKGAEREVSCFAEDPDTGIFLRGRMDFVRPDLGVVGDFKTVRNASKDAWERAIWDYGYHRQAAMYLKLASLCYGRPFDTFVAILCENNSPYSTRGFALDAATLEAGELQNRQALQAFAQCIEKGNFPGYPEEIESCALPYYAWDKIQAE